MGEVSVGVGLVVGAEDLAEVGEEAGLAGVFPILGLGLGLGLGIARLTVISTEDMDLVTHTMVTV